MKKLLFILSFIHVIAGTTIAQLQIEGYVKNIDEEPLPGVNVVVKGTSIGTVTDLKGYYKISDVPADGILIYSFLGMISEEIEVGDKKTIDVTMVDDIQNLEEVVVVGYGSVKRANLTGAVVDIKADELEDIPVGSLSAVLDGKLAGVKVNSSTGKPGEQSILQIRTESSFGRAIENVLYVIDGVIIEDPTDFNLLDASEIESISVLKDAAAAVYGARAAGGVVVVKTKRGSSGKPRLKYSGSYGIAQATKFPDMLSGSELATMYNDALKIYEGYGNPVSPFDYFSEDEINYFDSIPGYNWLDELLKTATTQKHTVSASGGTERVNYFVGGSYYKETGMMDMLSYSRYSIRSNIESEITENLKAIMGFNYSYSDKLEPYFSGESQSGVLRETYKQALTAAPWIPITINGKPVNNSISSNPLALLESGSYKNGISNNISIRGGLEYQIPFIKGLNINFQFSRSESNRKGKEFAQDYTQYTFPTGGTNGHIILDNEPYVNSVTKDNAEGIRKSSGYSKNYQINSSVNYSKSFGIHDLSALLVYEQSEAESNDYWTRIRRSAILNEYDYLWAFAIDEESAWQSGEYAGESGNQGVIGRLNYSYAQKYLFEGTFRYEGSEILHPDNRWGFFPAVSGGWVVSEENFFKSNVNFINFMKLRGSLGIVGNDNIPPFLWTPTFTAGESGPIFENTLTSAISARNGLTWTPTLKWQTTRSYNTGIDMRMINNHVNLTIDFYYRHTFDVLNRRSHGNNFRFCANQSFTKAAGIQHCPAE